MNELTTDLKSLHEETVNNLKSSKANNTLRAYKSDFKDFGAFCAKHGFSSLPSEPKISKIMQENIPATRMLIISINLPQNINKNKRTNILIKNMPKITIKIRFLVCSFSFGQ